MKGANVVTELSETNTSGEATPDTARPLGASDKERIGSLDFIRGIAVMGILWANIVAFGQPESAYFWPGGFLSGDGDPSGVLWLVQLIIIDGKMRGLFTLLFGAGMYLFMEKGWARGAGRALQARRLFWLMLFGTIHFYFIWHGDILMSYAFVGFIGLACLRWARRTQMIIGLLGYISGAILLLPVMGLPYFIAETPLGESTVYADMREGMMTQKAADLAEGQEVADLRIEGSYADFVAYNFTENLTDPLFYFFLALLETLPLMLIGMALYRMGLFDGGIPRSTLLKWGWAGVIVGSILTAAVGWWAMSEGLGYYASLAAFFGFSPLPRLPVTLGLAALLVAYAPRADSAIGSRITAAGRMAFSNYLGTSILMLFVFHGWALGLFGQLGRPALFLVVVATWAIMLLWSKPWLERFRYGPLEWLWRCLTYGRLFPIRR